MFLYFNFQYFPAVFMPWTDDKFKMSTLMYFLSLTRQATKKLMLFVHHIQNNTMFVKYFYMF